MTAYGICFRHDGKVIIMNASPSKLTDTELTISNAKQAKRLIKMPLYFILVLLIGWFPWYAQSRAGVIIAAPTLAAIIIALAYEGKSGLFLLARRVGRWRSNPGWYLFIFLIPALVALIAIGIHWVFGGDLPTFPLFRSDQFQILLVFFVFVFPLTSSAFLEEVGFRGYALPQLQKTLGPLRGTLVLGVFFGAWLLPEFYNSGTAQSTLGIGFYVWFIVTEIAWSLIMTWVFNRTNGSSLIAGWLLHAFFNAWTLLLLTNSIPGEALPLFDIMLFKINTVVLLVVSLVIVFGTKGKLGYRTEK